MPTTNSGYHAPNGASPIAGLLTTDDTDVALLSKSIEWAHARCEFTAGATSASSAIGKIGAITNANTTTPFYSKGGTDTRIVVAEDGWYRVSYRPYCNDPAHIIERGQLGKGPVSESIGDHLAGIRGPVMTFDARVEAGDYFLFYGYTDDGSDYHVEWAAIERVGP